jgi:hypothetical protein
MQIMLELFERLVTKNVSMNDPIWSRSLAGFIERYKDTNEVIPTFGIENKHRFITILLSQVLCIPVIQNKSLIHLGLTCFKILAREEASSNAICSLQNVTHLAKLLVIFHELSRSEDKQILHQEIEHEIMRCFVNMLYVCPEVKEWLTDQAGALDVITRFIRKPIEVDQIQDLKPGDIKKRLREYVRYHETMSELHLSTRIHSSLSELPELCEKIYLGQEGKVPLLVVAALNEIFIVEDFDNPIVIPIISAGLKILENYISHLPEEMSKEFYVFKLEENSLPSFLLSCLKIQVVPGLGYPLNHFVTRILNKAPENFLLAWTSANGIGIETPWNISHDVGFEEKRKRKSSFEFIRDLTEEERDREILLEKQQVNEEVLMLLMV